MVNEATNQSRLKHYERKLKTASAIDITTKSNQTYDTSMHDQNYKPTISTRSVLLNKEPADLTPSSLVQNMDAYSNFYEHDPENESEYENEESFYTHAPNINFEDLDSDELPGDVILVQYAN